jgi:hypothetical protein
VEETTPPVTKTTEGRVLGLFGGALMIAGGFVATVFGSAELFLGHFLAAAMALGEAMALAATGALVFLVVYPRERKKVERFVAKVIPLVVFNRVAEEDPPTPGKCARPVGRRLGVSSRETLPHRPELSDTTRARPHVLLVRRNPPPRVSARQP